ncbi:CDP-alcohol phosphatidyltransferase family protein [Nocardioides sp. C4-1]|uniref:CDP-alcohol phosphatidyltransferase family protein n=1 Tax=Nocardioides sp. C4-1 TaxID=3151851 RepID=UPI0032655DB1
MTLLGLLVTAVVPLVAVLGAAWPLLALVLLLVGVVLDGVDGAVAARTGTASPWGRVLDPLADRCADLLLVLTLVVLGGPWWLGVVVGTLTLLHESVRATAQAAGMAGPGAITVWERPSRVIVASFGTGLAGLEWCAREAGVGVLSDVDGAAIATGALGVGVALAFAGFVQLLVAVRQRLRGQESRGAQSSPSSPSSPAIGPVNE